VGQSGPDDLHTLLTIALVLMGAGMGLGILGHLTQLRGLVATGVALVFTGAAFFIVAVGQFG
jgi:hypothetical protein